MGLRDEDNNQSIEDVTILVVNFMAGMLSAMRLCAHMLCNLEDISDESCQSATDHAFFFPFLLKIWFSQCF